MKNAVILLSILFTSIISFSQINDVNFAQSMIGRKLYDVTTTLDSLNIYYKVHFPQSIKPQMKVISISFDGKSAKVFTFLFTKYDRVINKITINYRHDNLNHLKDLEKIKDVDYHVGKYSTDIICK